MPPVNELARLKDSSSTLELRKAEERLALVRQVETLRLTENIPRKAAVADIAANQTSESLVKLNYGNLRQWLHRLPKKGESYDFSDASPLLDNYKTQKHDISDKNNGIFWKAFWAFYCHQNKLSVEDSYRHATDVATRNMSGDTIPTKRQVRYAIEQNDQAAITLARYGEEAVKNKYIDFIRRDASALAPNDLWIADNRTFDLLVQIPGGNGAPTAVRPIVCAIIDAKSKEMVGWRVDAVAPNAVAVAETIASAIAMAGAPPTDFLADNGRDFKCHGLSLPCVADGHSHSIFNELGIQEHFSIPYNGRAKTIERVFRDVATTFDKWFCSYIGNKPSTRPDSAAYYHKHPELLYTMPQFYEAFTSYLKIRGDTPSDSLDGHTPAEVWAQRQIARSGDWSADRLRSAFLWPVGTRMVDRGPCVRVEKVEYFSDDLWPHLGKKLLVKVDRLSGCESASAYHCDGRLVCECRPRPKVPFLARTTADKEAIAANMRHQRRQLKSLHAHVATLAGPARLVQPLDVFDCDALPTEVVAGESMRSVKGASHTFRHHSLPPASAAAMASAQPSSTSAAEPAEAQSSAEKLAKFHAFVCASTEQAEEQAERQAERQAAAERFAEFLSASPV